jgi:hypothetical protein
VYRWTENEVRKTIYSYAPYAPHDIRFFYGLKLPEGRLPFENSHLLQWIPNMLKATIKGISAVFPKERNLFAFYIAKPEPNRVFPWMRSRDEFNSDYAGIGLYRD